MTTFATQSSFDAYVQYQAIKKHFTDKKYDFFKYNGKVRATFDKFQTRPDTYFFAKLAKKKDLTNFLVSNLLQKPELWVKDLIDDGDEVYLEWKKRIDGLTYTFKTDLSKLNENYFSNFEVKDGQHPFLLKLLLQRQISIETFSILAKTSSAFSVWETEIEDRFVASPLIFRAQRYLPFIDYDAKKFRAIVKESFDFHK